MINTTDLQELEVTLPGDWLRKDNGDTYSFTSEDMHLNDDRLFRRLRIRHRDNRPEEDRYALAIEDECCWIVLDNGEYFIRRLAKFGNGSAFMEWEDKAGGRIVFERLPQAANYA